MGAASVLTGVSGIAAGALAAGMAYFVYRAHSSRVQNRILALLLFAMGVEVASTFGLGELLIDAGVATTTSPAGRGLWAMNAVAFLSQPWLYLALLGTLDSPLARPWASRRARVVLLVLAAAPLVLWPLLGPLLAASVPLYYGALAWHGLVMLYGVVVAYSAYRRSPREGSATRAKARAFLHAFAVRDLGIASVVGLAIFVRALGSDLTDPSWQWAASIVPLSVAASILLMGYGIARAHLFDIDVKLRLTIRRGSVVTAFAAVFLIVAQVVEEFLGERLGWLAGGVAAGLLLFAISPLERAAERIARAAMPGAQALRELEEDERLRLYREQVELAWADGQMGLKERLMLDAMRERLRLPAEAALEVEREIVVAMQPA